MGLTTRPLPATCKQSQGANLLITTKQQAQDTRRQTNRIVASLARCGAQLTLAAVPTFHVSQLGAFGVWTILVAKSWGTVVDTPLGK